MPICGFISPNTFPSSTLQCLSRRGIVAYLLGVLCVNTFHVLSLTEYCVFLQWLAIWRGTYRVEQIRSTVTPHPSDLVIFVHLGIKNVHLDLIGFSPTISRILLRLNDDRPVNTLARGHSHRWYQLRSCCTDTWFGLNFSFRSIYKHNYRGRQLEAELLKSWHLGIKKFRTTSFNPKPTVW